MGQESHILFLVKMQVQRKDNESTSITYRRLRICHHADKRTSNVDLHVKSKILPLKLRRKSAICKFSLKKWNQIQKSWLNRLGPVIGPVLSELLVCQCQKRINLGTAYHTQGVYTGITYQRAFEWTITIYVSGVLWTNTCRTSSVRMDLFKLLFLT